MEFFAKVANQVVAADQLYELVTIERLPELCASIDSVVSIQSPTHGEIYCTWGEFQVSREKIRNGVRVALLNCPHALAWTVAHHANEGAVVIHCTIDDREADTEFSESIEQFVIDWAEGLQRGLSQCA